VTEAAHAGGAKIFVQLMHVGRVSHSANIDSGAGILAPSALAAPGQMWTDSEGMKDHPVPEAMTEEQIHSAIHEFEQSARLAFEAGLDGVEIHGANGYLVDQFLNTASNHRKDAWGAIGPERTGIRLSLYGVFNGMQPDPEMDALYLHLTSELDAMRLAYVHIVDHSSMGAPPVSAELKAAIRAGFKEFYILSGGYDRERAEAQDRNTPDRGGSAYFLYPGRKGIYGLSALSQRRVRA
jgi:N-ethylmaleimide reductase